MDSDPPFAAHGPSGEQVGVREPTGGDAGTEGGEPPKVNAKPRPSRSRRVLEWVVIIAMAVSVAVVVRTFVVQTFYIPSGSMEPTLDPGDRILVDKLSYHLHAVHRGDVIVFRRPPTEHCGTPVADLVKRVIGLPGETIWDRGGTVFVDGKPLAQPWLPKGHPKMTYTAPFGPIKIPANDYFVMGDNRVDSCDSRTWGFVPRSYIVGKVIVRIWPLSRIALF